MIKKNGSSIEYTDTMSLEEMDSCVRTISAFKSKGLFSSSKIKVNQNPKQINVFLF